MKSELLQALNYSRFSLPNLPLRTWTNPLAVPLPNAPTTKYVCFYGVGLDSERGFGLKPAGVQRSCTSGKFFHV